MLKIKELREYNYLSQTQLAEKLGTTLRNISHWENGESEPDFETVIRLADYFDVTLDELFGRDHAEKRREQADTAAENRNTLLILISHLTPQQTEALKNFEVLLDKKITPVIKAFFFGSIINIGVQ